MNTKEKRLMSIGEIAKSLGITRRIILNYEDKGLLTADFKDGSTGNRYYNAETLTKIRSIRVLQKTGLSLDDIHAYYDGTLDMPEMIHQLERLRDELNLNIEKLKQRVKSSTNFELQTLIIRPFSGRHCVPLLSKNARNTCGILSLLPCASMPPTPADVCILLNIRLMIRILFLIVLPFLRTVRGMPSIILPKSMCCLSFITAAMNPFPVSVTA